MTDPLRADLNRFLFAPIGQDSTGASLTVLTVLARLGVDPWEEAADLALLSLESAVHRLVPRLEAMPIGLAPHTDTAAVAADLIALLHRSPPPKASSTAAPLQVAVAVRSKSVDPAVYYLIALIIMFIAQWAVTRTPQAPADTTLSPPPRN